MTRTFAIAMALLAALSGVGAANPIIPDNAEFVERKGIFTKYRLKSNGMPIYLSQNRVAPVVTFMVVYHVGSRNEGPGHTGSVHLLEHLLAGKSTANFDKAKGHKTIPEALRSAGGSAGTNYNMTTSRDAMTGYATLPSSSLQLAMKVEADRLGRALILDQERQSEMTVVRNEFEISENSASETLTKSLIGTALVAHPYRWDPLGYRSDIEGVSTEKLRELYRTFFAPNNSEAILVGDFDTAEALATFAREFGSFVPSRSPIPRVITVEPPQEGERRVVVERPGDTGIVQAGYVRPGVLDPDFMPLFILSRILTDGVNSQLHQALVETQIATGVNASNAFLRDPFLLLFEASVAPGSTHQETEHALKAVLYDVAKNGVLDHEVSRVRKGMEVAAVRGRDGAQNLAFSLAMAIESASWEWWEEYIEALKRVSVADVNRVAATYLVPGHATTGWFVPVTARVDGPGVATPVATSEPRTANVKDPIPATRASDVSEEPDARPFAQRTLRRVLTNGVTLLIAENRATPTVALEATIAAASVTEPAVTPGLAALTAAMLERGTKTKDKRTITDALDRVGAELNFDVNDLEVTIKGSALSGDARLLLELLADQLKHPSFDAGEFEKVKALMKASVLEGDHDVTARAAERIRSIIFPANHPYSEPGRDEMLRSLASVTLDEVVQFHHDRYNGSSLILAISGDVDAAEIASMVELLFGDIPRGERLLVKQPRTEPRDAVREIVTLRGKANVKVIYGAASGLARTDADFEAARIANAALGVDVLSSRIGKRVRVAEGLSYQVTSAFYLSDFLDGYWAVAIDVAPANLKRALDSTIDEIRTFYRDGVTEEEVAEWREVLAAEHQIQLGTNAGVAAMLAYAESYGYGAAYLDEVPARLRRVTREEVNAAIKAHLHPDKLNLVIAGDVDGIPE